MIAASVTAPTPIVVNTIRPRFVAEVEGVDLSRPLEGRVFGRLRAAFAEHPVLVFHGQKLRPEHMRVLSLRFGPLEVPIVRRHRHPSYEDVSYISNVDESGNFDPTLAVRSTKWHSNGSFLDQPPLLTMLHCLEAPDQGGATLFADMHAAYETLPDGLKAELERRRASHRYGAGPLGDARIVLEDEDKLRNVDHPVVRVLPETGRKCLYVNGGHTERILGVGEAEATALLDRLLAHSTEDRFVHRHDWAPGDLVIWDDRATQHRGAGDAPKGQRRVMLRTIVTGTAVPR